MFLIPSGLGIWYAMVHYPYIRGYTPLLFDIELVKVIRGPGK